MNRHLGHKTMLIDRRTGRAACGCGKRRQLRIRWEQVQ